MSRPASVVLAVVAVASLLGGCRPIALPSGHPSLVESTGCTLEQVTDAGADDGHFQFHGPSPDGRRLVVGTYRGDTLGGYILDLETGRREPLARAHNGGDFSPDGKYILMATRGAGGRNDIIEHALDGTGDRLLAPHADHEFLPTYSRDGTRILFNSYRTGGSDIYWMRRDGGDIERLTTNAAYEAHADLSPDGRTVVFHRRVSATDYDIILLDLLTREERTLIGGPGEQAYPAWSPDGRRIAYVVPGAVPGTTDVVMATAAGAITQRITSTPAYHAYPSFAPDGRSLYLNAERDGHRNVYRVRLRGDGTCAAPGVQPSTPYAVLAPLIGEWDTGPAQAPPAFVQRFSWGPNQGYMVWRTSLVDGSGTEHLHFEGPILWNGVTRRFDYLFAVEPGSLSQEQGEIRVDEAGDIVRDVTLTEADGSVAHFRQTFHAIGQGRFETSLLRRAGSGWAPAFPGSDRLIMVRRPE